MTHTLESTLARLNAIASGPKPWIVTVEYESGDKRSIPCYSEQSAKMCAERESLNIGRALINRESGETVRKIAVSIEYKA